MARSEKQLRQELGIPTGAELTLIDLDATKTVETRLHGWTDEMITAKPLAEFDALIQQREQGVKSLQETIDAERAEIAKLREVRQRRLTLGD